MVSVHPSLSEEGPGPEGSIHVPSLFLTGGADFLTSRSMAKLERDMRAGASDDDAPSKTARYAEIFQGFRNWQSVAGYDARADARSWALAVAFLEAEFDMAYGGREELIPAQSGEERRTGGLRRRNGRQLPLDSPSCRR